MLPISAGGRGALVISGDPLGGGGIVSQRAHRVLAGGGCGSGRCSGGGDDGEFAADRAGQRQPQRRLRLHPLQLAAEEHPPPRAQR